MSESLTGQQCLQKDTYNIGAIMNAISETKIPNGKFSGQDSGFSSRNSVASVSEGGTEDRKKDESTVVLVGAGDDETVSNQSPACKKSPRTCSDGQQGKCCRLRSVPVGMLKCVLIVGLLYMFICSLDLLGNAFQLLGGKVAGNVFAQSELLLNPITGLMMGILATVLLQSSSTSTSIIITMVSSGIIDVEPAIPIIMGCNIGTTVTNTLVSLAHSSKGKEFERAFAGATVHDVFNWLTVMVLLPFEATLHPLYRLTGVLTRQCNFKSLEGKKQDLLKTLTKPLTKMVVQVDKKVITQIAEGVEGANNKRVLKVFCSYDKEVVLVNTTLADGEYQLANVTRHVNNQTCHSLFSRFHESLSDTQAGAILLVFSILLLTGCLVLLVKLLNSILKDRITQCLKKTINAKLPFPFAWFTGYLAILIGAGLTILVQSSSVFTSALTPLVGVGCLKLHRMYPLTLGSNIGTTATGILAAMAAPANKLDVAFQLALCHLFFNITGISLFYPVHFLRKLPLKGAKVLGRTTAKYRWFAVFYLILLFFILPGFFFALSLAGRLPFIITVSLLGLLVLFIVVVNVLQNKCKDRLPKFLQSWNWLPKPLRSFEPLDKYIRKFLSLFKKCKKNGNQIPEDQNSENEYELDEDIDDKDYDEDECTQLFGKLCCNKKQPESKDDDEGFQEEYSLLEKNTKALSPVHSPIYTPPTQKKIPGRHGAGNILRGNTLHTSPSATPLLQVVSNV